MNILFIGDIVGRPGRHVAAGLLPALKDRYRIDYTIANGENSAGGYGITPEIAVALLDMGIDFITTGNHIWEHKGIIPYLSDSDVVVRPMNISPMAPGKGFAVIARPGVRPLAVINMMGRVFMAPAECPFHTSRGVLDLLAQDHPDVRHVLVDFHAEATSEKQALGWFLDGRVTAVLGTHTHVQTSDEVVLPQGTAYITDAGMTGVVDGILGMDRDQIVTRFTTSVQRHADVAKGREELQGVVVTAGDDGRAMSISRIKEHL
ncbi:MAG: TIGR00282 family metallophosphoesterase [Deltaproteobacteria bacterium]|nr:TIGR00282 family metallophosphoesterase [Deltaproteobacteria bacterium]